MQCALPTRSPFPSPHRNHSGHTFFAFANFKTRIVSVESVPCAVAAAISSSISISVVLRSISGSKWCETSPGPHTDSLDMIRSLTASTGSVLAMSSASPVRQCPHHTTANPVCWQSAYLLYRICIARISATAEIARVGGRYAAQSHSRSLMLVPIESPYATSCSVNNTDLRPMLHRIPVIAQ